MKNIINSIVLVLTIAVFPLKDAFGSFTLLGGSSESPPPEKMTVSPISAPFLHEDAFVTTDLRAWYITHELGQINGSVDVAAVQARLALVENIQLLAYKNGYTMFNDTDLDPILDDGWNDIGLGIKYAIFQDWGSQTHIAIGFGYEFGVGDDQVLQDTDEYRFWLSINKGFGKLHFGAMTNYIIADGKYDGLFGNSDMLTVHLHADYYLFKWLSPIIELNGYFVQEGDSSTGAIFSGVDLGSINGGEDNDTITYALGFELRPFCESLGLRAAYEAQLNNDEESLFGYRWNFSAVLKF